MKYAQSGWWNTMALTLASGSIIMPSVPACLPREPPIRKAGHCPHRGGQTPAGSRRDVLGCAAWYSSINIVSSGQVTSTPDAPHTPLPVYDAEPVAGRAFGPLMPRPSRGVPPTFAPEFHRRGPDSWGRSCLPGHWLLAKPSNVLQCVT